jgi:acetyl-CoA acetyltransferase
MMDQFSVDSHKRAAAAIDVYRQALKELSRALPDAATPTDAADRHHA